MAFVGGLCKHYTPAKERAWQPAAQTLATRTAAQQVHSAAPTVLLTTSNRFATLPEADEQEQQLPSQPAKLDEPQGAAALIAAAAVAAVLRTAVEAEATGAAVGSGATGGGYAPPCPEQTISPRSVWDLRTHRQQQQQQQQPLSPSPRAWQRRLQPMLDKFQKYTVEEGADTVASHFKSTHDSEGGVSKREWREQMLVHPELVGKVCGAAVLTDWANKHFAVPCQAQDTSASHLQRGHIMFWRYLVLDDARQAGVCNIPEADVQRMHDDVVGCRVMHRMVFTPDREQPQWAMAGCACSTRMSVPCQPCMKPDTPPPLEPMPMFQDTVKEVKDDEECYALLMLFHSDLMHDEECFGKLTNTHCARYACTWGGRGKRDVGYCVVWC
ncbi:hypothetical protein QJQ45_015213 [Haematococcus lacustris]|nr:hypothetical protein QJQ45_015213 [Haematococcus lacustris]